MCRCNLVTPRSSAAAVSSGSLAMLTAIRRASSEAGLLLVEKPTRAAGSNAPPATPEAARGAVYGLSSLPPQQPRQRLRLRQSIHLAKRVPGADLPQGSSAACSPTLLVRVAVYRPRMRCTSARACSQVLWSPARSASRARAMLAWTACTLSGDISPSFASAAAIESGVG